MNKQFLNYDNSNKFDKNNKKFLVIHYNFLF